MPSNFERRNQSRHPASFKVYLFAANSQVIELRAANYSEDGLYVLSQGHQMPPLGSMVEVKLANHPANTPEPPLLEMIIKRVDKYGAGLQYFIAA
jgi:hypothetical protein